jgi:hypothetical protein
MAARHGVRIAFGALALAATPALAQPAAAPQVHVCGGVSTKTPEIKPIIYPSLQFDRSNPGFDCQMWQAFIYLNWPALAGQRGVPNPNAKFGAAGTTVWETYKTVEQTFLPNAANPGSWSQGPLMAVLVKSLAQQVSTGTVRNLTRESKVSRQVISNLVRSRAALNSTILDSIVQASGGILYDLNGRPVYYEVSLNQDQYNYTVQNGLYNANTQATFAATNVIALPGGPTAYGPTGAIETKAAWKVLTPAEAKSGRFYMTKALIPSVLQPVTVGLVGFHIFQTFAGISQGAWATFYQVDNAPLLSEVNKKKGPYNFYKAPCWPPTCQIVIPYNIPNANPGQVVQIDADDPAAINVNKYMQTAIKAYNATAPWQYYALHNVQWPEQPVDVSKLPPPQKPNLPDGNPNTQTMVNAVLETFIQTPGTGCLACHIGAPTASGGYASSYSFTFSNASTPPVASR